MQFYEFLCFCEQYFLLLYKSFILWYSIFKGGVICMEELNFLKNLCISELNSVTSCVMLKEYYPHHNPSRLHHGFVLTISGSETYYFKDKTITATPMSILFTPKEENYKIDLDNSPESVVLCCDFEMVNTPVRPFLIKLQQDSPIPAYFENAIKCRKKQHPASLAECKALFYEIVTALIKQHFTYLDSEKSQQLSKAVAYIKENCLSTTFRLNEVSQFLGISQRYFEKLFLQKYSVSPKEYIVNFKMQKAKDLLYDKKASIKEIAEQLGFCDIYHFSKTFKAKTGFTPSEYKNNSR